MRRYNRTKILSIFKGRQQRKKERDRDNGQKERRQKRMRWGKRVFFFVAFLLSVFSVMEI